MKNAAFELLGGALCLDFVNTIHEYGGADPDEELHSYDDLLRFGVQTGAITRREAGELSKWATGHPQLANRTLSDAREIRFALYRIFSALAARKRPPARDLESLNEMLARFYKNLRIQAKGDLRLEWSWNENTQNLDRVLWPIVRSAAELLTSSDRLQVGECRGDTCTWLFLDQSKNRTRRWCDMKKCGNRAKWRRHYNKHRKRSSSTADR